MSFIYWQINHWIYHLCILHTSRTPRSQADRSNKTQWKSAYAQFLTFSGAQSSRWDFRLCNGTWRICTCKSLTHSHQHTHTYYNILTLLRVWASLCNRVVFEMLSPSVAWLPDRLVNRLPRNCLFSKNIFSIPVTQLTYRLTSSARTLVWLETIWWSWKLCIFTLQYLCSAISRCESVGESVRVKYCTFLVESEWGPVT